jgi:hypothetical protein
MIKIVFEKADKNALKELLNGKINPSWQVYNKTVR